MSNRTLFFLTALVILSMIALLAFNMKSILTGEPPNETYLKYNNIRGMAISHNQMLYTLDFKQQNAIASILNFAVPVNELKTGKRQAPNFDKLIVYQFEGEPEIVLTPVAIVDQDYIFSVPKWVQEGYLMELSEGDLQTLISKTYD